MARWLVVLVAAALAGCRAALPSASHGHEHASGHAHDLERPERPPPLCYDLRCAWRAPVDHAHESRRGAPYVHAFHVEPAFLGRDLLVHAEREGDERALETEVEWALTRRLLLVAELPLHETEADDGLGDLGLGLRGLFVETDRFLLSGQIGLEVPTADGDLGADEVVVAPSLLAWGDLGGLLTLQGGTTLAIGTETGDVELSWGAALVKSFPCRPLLSCGDGHHDHGSWLSLMLEGRGTYGLSGPDEGTSAHEALLGISVPIADGLDGRAGWNLRWEEEDDAAQGWVVGLVVHL